MGCAASSGNAPAGAPRDAETRRVTPPVSSNGGGSEREDAGSKRRSTLTSPSGNSNGTAATPVKPPAAVEGCSPLGNTRPETNGQGGSGGDGGGGASRSGRRESALAGSVPTVADPEVVIVNPLPLATAPPPRDPTLEATTSATAAPPALPAAAPPDPTGSDHDRAAPRGSVQSGAGWLVPGMKRPSPRPPVHGFELTLITDSRGVVVESAHQSRTKVDFIARWADQALRFSSSVAALPNPRDLAQLRKAPQSPPGAPAEQPASPVASSSQTSVHAHLNATTATQLHTASVRAESVSPSTNSMCPPQGANSGSMAVCTDGSTRTASGSTPFVVRVEAAEGAPAASSRDAALPAVPDVNF